ncbi:g6809 [Coccomyxa viridis]|uniref:Arginine decarboxylase n=1 Tax=Coccomyxa viridis TaxID=1274662 RepID=A0ABP1FW90_9CHLO
MAQALVDHYGGDTAFKTGYALHDVLLKDTLRPVDSFSSLEGVRVGSIPSVEGAGWKVNDSRSLYAVKGWGGPYFLVDDSGRLCVKPSADAAPVDVYKLCRDVRQQGVQFPMLLRFPEIVRGRLHELQGCFNHAIALAGYQGVFSGVFPVKCNHDCGLIEGILEAGRPCNFGLEVGSKAELLMAMSKIGTSPGALLICNGYKDAAFMRLAVHCWELGIKAVIVLEQTQELDVLLEEAAKAGVQPVIGMRAKLATRHGGHWGTTSGENAKFGLSPSDMVAVMRKLTAAGMADCLQLLHFHIGSQITNLSVVTEAASEAAYLYAELAHMGAAMRYLDCGGGLGIDYDGTASESHSSLPFSIQDYASGIVCAVQSVCTEKAIPVPTVVTESGRALVSHHAVLIFDVISRQGQVCQPPAAEPEEAAQAEHHVVKAARKEELSPRLTVQGQALLQASRAATRAVQPTAASMREAYLLSLSLKEQALKAFKGGCISLEERASVDLECEAMLQRVRDIAAASDAALPDDVQLLCMPPVATYHINLSVFRSAPDMWAIQQLFPIMPIHRLDEQPTVSAILADLTCDSDGRIDRFISAAGSKASASTLKLHELKPGEPYLLGMFLTGAYQEVMGSAHNMLGTLNVVTVRSSNCSNSSVFGDTPEAEISPRLRGPGYAVDTVEHGESACEVLTRANHVRQDMVEGVRATASAAASQGRMEWGAAKSMLKAYERLLDSYTYLSL